MKHYETEFSRLILAIDLVFEANEMEEVRSAILKIIGFNDTPLLRIHLPLKYENESGDL